MKPTLVEEKTTATNEITFDTIPAGPFLIVIGCTNPRNHQKVEFAWNSSCALTFLAKWADGYLAYSPKGAIGKITISSTNGGDYGAQPIKGSLITLT